MIADSTVAVQYHPAWNSLPTLVWTGLLVLGVLVFRKRIGSIWQVFEHRVRRGAGLKLGVLEIGHAYVAPGGSTATKGSVYSTRKDVGEVRFTQREVYYKPNRLVMLVHRIAPSAQEKQLYDVLIYCVPHPKPDATLIAVKKVDYYFGKSWGSMIFTSIDRARGFAVATSAWGPFMCTAEIHFNDGRTAMVSRYIDFEMGAIGPAPLPEEEKPAREKSA